MPPFIHTLSANLDSSLLELSVFGEISLPDQDAEFNFQVDIDVAKSPGQFWFGLVDMDAAREKVVTGFAVRIDLDRGEICDAIHGTGILGQLNPEMISTNDDAGCERELLMLSLKVERLGNNLLPTLKIGGEICLCPAITTSDLRGRMLTAVAGAAQPGRDAEPFCHFPAFWLNHSSH